RLGPLPVLQVPAAADFSEKHLAILDVLQFGTGVIVAAFPFSLLEKALQLLHGSGVISQFALGFPNQFLEVAAVGLLDTFIDECRVGQVGQEIIDPPAFNRQQNRRQRFLGRLLWIIAEVRFDAVALGRAILGWLGH